MFDGLPCSFISVMFDGLSCSCIGVIFDGLSCTFASLSVLTVSYSFT